MATENTISAMREAPERDEAIGAVGGFEITKRMGVFGRIFSGNNFS